MDELSDYGGLAEKLGSAKGHLDASWDYRSHDNYRTETYTETSTDSDGNTTTETKTRQVYEDTDHYFHYHRSEAKAAEKHMKKLRVQRNQVTLSPPNVARMQVELSNLNDAERMFLKRLYALPKRTPGSSESSCSSCSARCTRRNGCQKTRILSESQTSFDDKSLNGT